MLAFHLPEQPSSTLPWLTPWRVAIIGKSLGTLVDEGHRQIIETKWMLIFPASVLALLMLCFTFVGDGLRDALDPRGR